VFRTPKLLWCAKCNWIVKYYEEVKQFDVIVLVHQYVLMIEECDKKLDIKCALEEKAL
jgi:hypothetical protein